VIVRKSSPPSKPGLKKTNPAKTIEFHKKFLYLYCFEKQIKHCNQSNKSDKNRR